MCFYEMAQSWTDQVYEKKKVAILIQNFLSVFFFFFIVVTVSIKETKISP